MECAHIDDVSFLLGIRPISELFVYARTRVMSGQDIDKVSLAAQWRAAHARYRQLASSEESRHERPQLEPLESSLQKIAEDVTKDPSAQKYLCLTPYRWATVALDQLITYQRTVNLSFVKEIQTLIGPAPTERRLLDISLGEGLHRPSITRRNPNESTFCFLCHSNDLRPLGTTVFEPSELSGYVTAGRPVVGIALLIGFGLNILTVLQVGNQAVLVNGTHRAYAMRSLGIERVPCLVQQISTEEDLDLLAAGESRLKIERALRMPRPPLFKDYLDPQLTKRFLVPRTQPVLKVQWTTELV